MKVLQSGHTQGHAYSNV